MDNQHSKRGKDRNIAGQTIHENSSGDAHPQRRLEDRLKSKKNVRHMNLDRRKVNYDRRSISDNDYKGPARRLTIDRRMRTRDRRVTQP